MSDPELVLVSSLLARCALKVRNLDQPAYAASDACGQMAAYVVEMPSGSRLYRCIEHRNVRWLPEDHRTARYYRGEDQTGPTYATIPIRRRTDERDV